MMSGTSDNKAYVNVSFEKPVQFVGPSVESGQPISYPLSDIKQLMSWKANDANDRGQAFNISTVPHNPKLLDKSSSRTLFCHDMKGGYLCDRFVQGMNCADDIYYFKYWNMVDVFVYFSHHFITVPPVGWVNAAHRNGVTILGTFITESKSGYEICKQIFASETSWKEIADQLCAIAKFYGFDGWLLNIENVIDKPMIPNLKNFISYLSEQMHVIDEDSLVIWYDAVTVDGVLEWQNELNSKNKCFYDECDGIFLNYSWQEENLIVSKANAEQSPCKVYVGVDVFGRGCYGGGGFNSSFAAKLVRKYDMSLALFAPGWVYEEFGPYSFEKNNKRFWAALQPSCNSYSLNCQNGLASRFNPGGECRRWSFLNTQDLMPLLPQAHLTVTVEEKSKTGKLVVTASKSAEKIIRIFQLTMNVSSKFASLLVPADSGCCFVLETDHGVLYPKEDWIMLPPPRNNAILCSFVFDEPFKVEGIGVQVKKEKEKNHSVSFIGLFPHVLADRDLIFSSPKLTITDIDWKKAASQQVFTLGATLQFRGVPKTICSSEVRCFIHSYDGDETRYLGSSFCGLFRVHDLAVPNPKYCGPGCTLTFVVTHLSGIGMKVCESELIVNYAENFHHEK